jgi:DNA-binding transcriptional ArsR family regulator
VSQAPGLDARPALLDLDRTVHEPARLVILSVLSAADLVEFRFLETTTGLSKGNLSSHTIRLEQAGFVEVIKSFRGRTLVTSFRITEAGRAALAAYWETIRAAIPPAVRASGTGT